MLTECPHCLTVLKVSAELIYAGDPRVRCGECLRVFSARDHLTQVEADLDVTKVYLPPKRELATTDGPAFSLQPEVAEGLRALVDKPKNRKNQNSPSKSTHPVERPRRAAIPSRVSDIKPEPEKNNKPVDVLVSSDSATKEIESSKKAGKSEKANRHISVLSRSNNSSGRSVPIRSISVVTILLLAALTLLAIDAVRSVMTNPNLKDSLGDFWCSIGTCETAVSRDFSNLQIVRRKIYAHPKIEGVLVISLAMINRQQTAMEYPTLQVRMTDQSGEIIARGHFEPTAYVPGFEPGMTIAPERIVDVVLQVEDPGDAAQSFDLEFL